MSEVNLKSDSEFDADQNYSMNSNVDPKNMAELTVYVGITF